MSIRTLLFCSLAFLPTSFAQAAEPMGGPVYQDAAQADADFPFQGEYRGYQRPQDSLRSSQAIGLQVMAIGDGKFMATKYYGGLPGEGWYGGKRYEMTGERAGDAVHFHTDQYDYQVADGVVKIFTKTGREAGLLQPRHRVSPTMGVQPPPGAIVLFDGTNTDLFKRATMTPDGLLEAGTETIHAYQNFRLHSEFRLPYKPFGRGQDRCNSGFYLQSRYELQVLDSFGLEGVENECGSIYRTKRPDINMCLAPLEWQTYDVDFTAPKFDASGNKISDMQISVWHNGVLIHNNARISNKTGAGQPEGPQALVTKLQDHGNPVVYRNIWLVEKADGVGNSSSWVKLPLKAPPVPTYQFQPRSYFSMPVTSSGQISFCEMCP